MGTSTPGTGWGSEAGPATTGSAPLRLRQLWQVPLFLGGVLALTGVCLARPLWHGGDLRRLERQLASAAAVVAERDYAIEDLLTRLEPVLAARRRYPGQAAQAHFLVGSAYVMLAERRAKTAPQTCADLWTHARRHLEEADHLGLGPERPADLAFRLGKAWYHTRAKRQQVIEALSASVGETSDDPAEGYALLTQAYLDLAKPDLQGALEANRRLLQLPTVNEDLLAPARLQRGELLLRAQNPAEAREVLKFLKPPAPPALVAQARYLQAKTYQEEEQWAEAAQHWKELLDEGTVPPAESARYLYQLGICYRHLDQGEAAAQAWERVAQLRGDEAQAAALALAELRLHGQAPESALPAFERSVRDVQRPEDWRSTVLELDRARRLFERGCVIYHTLGRYELAMQTADLYQKLAAPGNAQMLCAQAAEAAARVRREQAAKAQTALTAQLEREVSRGLYAQAARKYHEAANAPVSPAEQGERLWRAAECCASGDDPKGAIATFERCIQLNQPSERIGEAWLLMGEAHRGLSQDAEAVKAFAECVRLNQTGAQACRARLQMAQLLIARGSWDKAEAELDLNLKTLAAEPHGDCQEATLYELGALLYRRGNSRMGHFRLEEALTRYPDSPRAPLARFQLGECYRSLATQEGENLRRPEKMLPETMAHHQRQQQAWIEKASTVFEELVRQLQRPGAPALTEEQQALFSQAAFAAANCRYDLGLYRDAVAWYEGLASRYQGRIECLNALAGMARCYWSQNDKEKARATVERIRTAMGQLSDAQFSSPSSPWSRQEWEKWLKDVSK